MNRMNEEFMEIGMRELNCSRRVIETLEVYRVQGVNPKQLAHEPVFASFYKRYLQICENEKLRDFFKKIFVVAEVGETGLCITDVIFNDPATIVKWADGTKTIVKCGEHDKYDREKGLAMAIIKKMCDNSGNFNEIFKDCGCYSREVPAEEPTKEDEIPAEEPAKEANPKKIAVKRVSKKKKSEKK